MNESLVRPFKIAVPEGKLARLATRLALTELPSELETDVSAPWHRGPPVSQVQYLLHYWRTEYDWREAERLLNESLPQFTTSIALDEFGSYDIHFVHMKSSSPKAIPLLFLHGWPGSFYEVSKIAMPLAEGAGGSTPTFHVVAPSLVDHGFSSGSRKENFHTDQHAEVVHRLMLRLGYERYVAQGGDTGYLICRMLAQLYPAHCVAHHINMAVPAEPTQSKNPEIWRQWKAQGDFGGLSVREKEQLERAKHFQKEGSGYFAIHATRPMALAYAIADSPIGLLSWILDKLVTWTDSYPWEPKEILTWISIYYFSTAGPAASFNTYFSNQHRPLASAFEQAVEYTNVPIGISRFSKEILNMPKLWNRTLGPIVFEREHEHGGHFAAFEVPDLLVQDLRDMFKTGGKAHNAARGML